MSDVTTTGRRSRSGRIGRAGAWLLAVAVAGSALAVGSVHALTLCVVTGVLTLAMTLAWWRAEPMAMRPMAALLLAVGVGLTTYTALQCVPLPIALLRVIAPHNADVWERALAPLHEPGPTWATISLDPPATRIALLRGVAYLLAFLTALRVARTREGAQFVCNAALASALLVAIGALVNVSLHEDKLFGVYAPHDPVMPRHIAPLLDPNHLAAYVNVGFCVALANGLNKDSSATERSMGLVGAVLLGATELWIGSRGGVAAMVLGTLLVLTMTRARRGRVRVAPLVAGLMIAAGVAMAVLGQSDGPFGAWEELATVDASKFGIFRQAAKLLALYPVFGTGRGAFESTFPEVRTTLGYYTVSHPENVVLQWTTEWGLPVALAGFVLLAVALRPSVVLARSQAALGAWAAIAVVAVHNLVDFSSEIPAVMIVLACAAAVVVGGVRVSSASSWALRWGEQPRRLAVGAAALACGAGALVAATWGHDLTEDRDAVVRLVQPAGRGVPGLRDALRADMLRHPAEPYFPYAGALGAVRGKEPDVMPWVERTLERAPVYGSAHALLAQQLRARFPAQARMEYRIAIEQLEVPSSTGQLTREAAPIVHDYDEAMEVAPQGPERVLVLSLLAETLADRLPATTARIDQLIVAARPTSPASIARTARARLADVQAGPSAPWCEARRAACEEEALAAAKRLQEVSRTSCEGYLLEARVRLAMGQKAKAVDVMAEHVGEADDAAACLGAMAYVAIDAGDDARATLATDRLAHLPCDGPSDCGRNLLAVANIEVARGNKRRALVYYRRVYELDPGSDYLLGIIADTSLQVGLYVEAVQSYTTLVSRHPGDARYAADLVRAKDMLVRDEVRLPH